MTPSAVELVELNVSVKRFAWETPGGGVVPILTWAGGDRIVTALVAGVELIGHAVEQLRAELGEPDWIAYSADIYLRTVEEVVDYCRRYICRRKPCR